MSFAKKIILSDVFSFLSNLINKEWISIKMHFLDTSDNAFQVHNFIYALNYLKK